jgi:hypothetical protein
VTLAALLLCALAQAEDGGLGAAPRARARWVDPPRAVELGAPFALVLEIEHASGDAPAVAPGELASDPAWAVLEGGTPLALPDLVDPRRRVSEVRWTVVALEAGTLALPAPALSYAAPEGGTPQDVAVESAHELEVAGVLAEGEDEPRPMPADLGVDEAARGSLWPAFAAGAVAALAALAAVFVLRRARREPAPAPRPPTPLERLAALEEAALDDPGAVRAAHVALSSALREHLDAGRARAALTDEEWLEALRLPADGELARLLAECRPVEYGGELPTHWATRERVARARQLAGGAP